MSGEPKVEQEAVWSSLQARFSASCFKVVFDDPNDSGAFRSVTGWSGTNGQMVQLFGAVGQPPQIMTAVKLLPEDRKASEAFLLFVLAISLSRPPEPALPRLSSDDDMFRFVVEHLDTLAIGQSAQKKTQQIDIEISRLSVVQANMTVRPRAT